MWNDFFERTWWLWIIVCGLVLIVGIQKCSEIGSKYQGSNGEAYKEVVIDGCEYITRHEGYSGYMAHKGNCKYCAIRQKNMVDSIVKANK